MAARMLDISHFFTFFFAFFTVSALTACVTGVRCGRRRIATGNFSGTLLVVIIATPSIPPAHDVVCCLRAGYTTAPLNFNPATTLFANFPHNKDLCTYKCMFKFTILAAFGRHCTSA